MWLENLKELKKKSGKRSKEIAAGTGLPERTVVRIFSGETDNPSISTLIPIVNFLGGSLDEIFADTNAIVGDRNLTTLQADLALIKAERDSIALDNITLKEQIVKQAKELELLTLKLMYTEELLNTHKFYEQLYTNKQ